LILAASLKRCNAPHIDQIKQSIKNRAITIWIEVLKHSAAVTSFIAVYFAAAFSLAAFEESSTVKLPLLSPELTLPQII